MQGYLSIYTLGIIDAMWNQYVFFFVLSCRENRLLFQIEPTENLFGVEQFQEPVKVWCILNVCVKTSQVVMNLNLEWCVMEVYSQLDDRK